MPKPDCAEEFASKAIEFGRLGRRVMEGRFDGGSMTSDGGVMLLACIFHAMQGQSVKYAG